MLLGSTVLVQLIAICAMPIVTRIYSPGQIGIASLFMSFFGFWSQSLSLRYENALLITDDAESHIVYRLSIILVIILSFLGTTILFFIHKKGMLEFNLLPAWSIFIAFPIFIGNGFFSVSRAWALRGGLIRNIANASISKAIIYTFSKIGFGILGWGVFGLFFAELVGACVATLKLMLDVKHAFSISKPKDITQKLLPIGKKFIKFPLLETPSAWLDALGAMLPLPFIITLFGAEAAGWFSLARIVVSMPNAQIGSAVADVFQKEFGSAISGNNKVYARKLFYSTLNKMTVLGMLPLFGSIFILPFAIPFVFGEKWMHAGQIAATLAPWFYSALIVSPLSRSLSVLQTQQFKLLYDIFSLALLVSAFFIAKVQEFTLLEFCIAISLANVLAYIIYIVLIIKLVDNRLEKYSKGQVCAE